jgi:intracellular sulfur oxidation DsrE/DsrF family protein
MSKAIRFLAMLCVFAMFASVAAVTAQESKNHRLVLQVSTEDPDTMNLAINNAMNAKRYYDGKGETLTVEIVTYGPGITMLRSDNSPVKERIAEARTSIPTLTLSMCANSKAGAERREGKEIVPLPGVQVVPAGIARVMELQEQGYSYARP